MRKFDQGIQLYRLHTDPVKRNLWIDAIRKSEVVGGKTTNKAVDSFKVSLFMQQTFHITSDSYHKLLLASLHIRVVEIQADGFHDKTVFYLVDDLTDLRQPDKMPQTPIAYTKLRGTTFVI